MKRWWRTGILAACGLLWSASFALGADTIKIGVAGAHSGDLASYGLPTKRAAELVIREVNAKGGILGRQVEILAEDDACKPEVAVNSATKLVSQGAHVILGHSCSGAAKTAMGIYREAGLAVVSSSATNPELTRSGRYPLFFRTIAPDDAQARLIVDFILNILKLKKIAVLHDKGDYGKGFADYARQFLEQSRQATVVLFEGITPGAVDYTAVVQKIRQNGAEAVVFGGFHPEAASIVSQMRKKNNKIPFLSDDGVKDDTFIKVAGRYAEGVYATGPRETGNNPMTKAAEAAHRQAFKADPGAFFLNGYAAAQVIVAAIQKARSTKGEDIARVLRGSQVSTTLGRISFDRNGDALGVGFSIYQVKNGIYAEVKR